MSETTCLEDAQEAARRGGICDCSTCIERFTVFFREQRIKGLQAALEAVKADREEWCAGRPIKGSVVTLEALITEAEKP